MIQEIIPSPWWQEESNSVHKKVTWVFFPPEESDCFLPAVPVALPSMKFTLLASQTLLQAALAISSPTLDSSHALEKRQHASTRPSIHVHPHHPLHPPPHSPPRKKVCYVKTHGDGVTDDSTYILQAIHACNPGGYVVFDQGKRYIVGTALDLTFLSHIDIGTCCLAAL